MKIIAQAEYAKQFFDCYISNPGTGTDEGVSNAILSTINGLLGQASDIPQGPVQKPVTTWQDADAAEAIRLIAAAFEPEQPGVSHIAFVGEDHTSSGDKARAVRIIEAVNNGPLDPTMVIFERGMEKYPSTRKGVLIRESNLTTTYGLDFGKGFSRKWRSMVVAGYLTLCHGRGSQKDVNRTLLFFGENHHDILEFYDYFALHSNAEYLEKEPRNYLLIKSEVH